MQGEQREDLALALAQPDRAAGADARGQALAAEQLEPQRRARRRGDRAAGDAPQQVAAVLERLGQRLAPAGERDRAAVLGQRDRPAHPSGRVRDQHAPVAADHRRPVAPEPRRALQVGLAHPVLVGGEPEAQRVLGHPGGCADEPERVRMRRAQRPADVDDAEQRARHGVVDRRRRAPPRVLLGQEVLGAEDLHGVVDRQRGADRVRARAVLGPAHALGELDPLDRVVLDALVALEPEDPALGVADDHHVLGVVGERAEAAAQDRHHVGDRRVGPGLDERVRVERAVRAQTLGVEAGELHPRPRLLDHGARLERAAAAFERGLPHPPQVPRMHPHVGAGIDGDEGVARLH